MSNLNNRLEYIAKKIFYAIVMLSSASYCVEVIKHLKKAADWRPFCFLGHNMQIPTELVFRPASELPTKDLDGREVIVINPCDGWHLGVIYVEIDDDFVDVSIRPWMGSEMTPHDFYVAWALLPSFDDLSQKYDGERHIDRRYCVCNQKDNSTAEHK